jgi:hypothetical protein
LKISGVLLCHRYPFNSCSQSADKILRIAFARPSGFVEIWVDWSSELQAVLDEEVAEAIVDITMAGCKKILNQVGLYILQESIQVVPCPSLLAKFFHSYSSIIAQSHQAIRL